MGRAHVQTVIDGKITGILFRVSCSSYCSGIHLYFTLNVKARLMLNGEYQNIEKLKKMSDNQNLSSAVTVTGNYPSIFHLHRAFVYNSPANINSFSFWIYLV